MFVDLRGFTRFAETLPVEQVIEVLDSLPVDDGRRVLDHGGTLVDYLGDGLMAAFGAPVERVDHADRAVAAAIDMATERLADFNGWLRADGVADGFAMGIGLNSGRVMSGTLGSERRFDYAVIGDTVNTAARIEQLTKQTGTRGAGRGSDEDEHDGSDRRPPVRRRVRDPRQAVADQAVDRRDGGDA